MKQKLSNTTEEEHKDYSEYCDISMSCWSCYVAYYMAAISQINHV